jgi:hypothetical protein
MRRGRWAANAAFVELAGGAVEGRPLVSLFCPRTAAEMAVEIRLAQSGERRWRRPHRAWRHGQAGRGAREAAADGWRHLRVRRLLTFGDGQAALRGRLLEQAAVSSMRRSASSSPCPTWSSPAIRAWPGCWAMRRRTHRPQPGPGLRLARPLRGVHRRSDPRADDRQPVRKERDPAAPPRRQPIWCRIRAKAVDMSSREAGTIWILEDVTRRARR